MNKIKYFLFFFSLLTLSNVVFSQKTISGTVKDERGKIIDFANVVLTNTSIGTKTNSKGEYSLKVDDAILKKNPSLRVSKIGFKTEIQDISGDIVNIVLSEKVKAIDEVVVTAQGIKRKKNTLPFAVQQIRSEEVSETRQSNFVQNLSGKAAGIDIKQSNTMGGSTNVVIRGNKSLTGNNQALFVVDGVPFFNANINEANQKAGRNGFDYGNSSSDINPDDIESVSILKGAAASALYGSMANNGVVFVTTKKFKSSSKKALGVNVQTGLTIGTIDKSTFIKYQKKYGAGYGQYYGSSEDPYMDEGDPFSTGTVSQIVPTYEDASWGAALDGRLVYQWDAFDPNNPNYQKLTPYNAAKHTPVDFFENSVNVNNSIFVTGGSDDANFKFGYTRNDETGILPNSKIIKNAFNLAGGYNVLENLNLSASANYTTNNTTGRYGTGYNTLMSSFRQWWQVNVDVEDQKNAYFRNNNNATWNISDVSGSPYTPIYWNNPYWDRYENYTTDSRNRFFGYGQMIYNPFKTFTITGRAALDNVDYIQEERLNKGSIALEMPASTEDQPSGYYKASENIKSINYDLIGNYNKDLDSNWNFKGLLGFNSRRVLNERIESQTNGGLVLSRLYSLSNSVNTPEAPKETKYETLTNSLYGGVTLSYMEMLILDATLRGDKSSTLPEDNNTFLYPSASLGFVFSKWKPTHKNFLNPDKTYGKLRLNYAEVGNSAPAQATYNTLVVGSPFGSSSMISNAYTLNNNKLKPERTKSWETGLEMTFDNSRYGFDITYYNTRSVDQIMPVDISNASGWNRKYVNSGEVENEGVELMLFGTPYRNNDFSWDVNINWTKNNSKVLSLYDNVDNLQLASMQGGVSINATPGEAYGSIRGTDYIYHENGKRIVGTNGHYVRTSSSNNIIGNAQPDWTGGITNKFKYKDFTFSFLIDVKSGGDIFSLDMYYGLATGLPFETAVNNDLGNPLRDAVADGGGLINEGVLADGTVNTKRVSLQNFGAMGYARLPNKAFVYDASYVKLREVVLSYNFPKNFFKSNFIKNASVSFFGRNLWIIHKNLPHADPEEIVSSGNFGGYQSSAYPTVKTFGFNFKFGF